MLSAGDSEHGDAESATLSANKATKRDGRGKLTQYLATEPAKAYIRTRTFRSAQMSKSHTPEVLEKVSIRNTFPFFRFATKSLPSPPRYVSRYVCSLVRT